MIKIDADKTIPAADMPPTYANPGINQPGATAMSHTDPITAAIATLLAAKTWLAEYIRELGKTLPAQYPYTAGSVTETESASGWKHTCVFGHYGEGLACTKVVAKFPGNYHAGRRIAGGPETAAEVLNLAAIGEATGLPLSRIGGRAMEITMWIPSVEHMKQLLRESHGSGVVVAQIFQGWNTTPFLALTPDGSFKTGVHG